MGETTTPQSAEQGAMRAIEREFEQLDEEGRRRVIEHIVTRFGRVPPSDTAERALWPSNLGPMEG